MASISKLSLRGIRAFSPDDEEQCIEFYFPCTVIVGQNGCGKTTIIEALKYAVTGGLPPGNKNGQAFVHDPRSIGQNVVKANVKLRFTNRSGKSMVCIRSMELKQNKRTVTFKQLDGVLRMIGDDGVRVSLSHKCTELDKQLPALLGISKPIIDHVLFCHQEDASWPLQEGATLKKKFDEIFDSAKYTKALEAYRKTEKELVEIAKNHKENLAALGSHKHAVEGFVAELQEQSEQEEELSAEQKDLADKISKIEKELAVYNTISDKVDAADLGIGMLKSQQSTKRAALAQLQTMMDEDLTSKYSLQELRLQLSSFGDKMKTQQDDEERFERQLALLNSKMDTHLHQREMDLKLQLGKLDAGRTAHGVNLKERLLQMESIAQTYQVDLSRVATSQSQMSAYLSSLSQGASQVDEAATQELIANLSPDDMRSFFRVLEKKEQELENNLKSHKVKAQADEDKLSNTIAELQGQVSSIESEKQSINNKKAEVDQEIKEVNNKLQKTSRMRETEVEEANKNAIALARQRDDALANPRKNQVPLLIKQLEDKAEKIKRTLEDDRLTLESLRESAKEQNTISHLKDQRASDYAVLKDSIQEHVSTMARFNIPLINNLPSPEVSNGDALVTTIHDVAEVIHDKYYDLDSQLTRATADATKSDRAFSEKNALLTSTQRQLQIEKPKMNRLEDAMKQVRNVVEEIRVYDDALTVDEKHPSELAAYLDRELEEITSAAPMVPETAKKLLRRLLKMVKNGDEFTCPCCKREIETNDVPAFSDNLQALMSDDSPLVQKEMSKSGGDEMKTKIQDWRKIVSTNVGDVRDYWRLIDDIRRLEHDANHLKADVDSARASLDAANGEVRDIQIELTQARELFDASKRWTDDANRIAGKSVLISQKTSDLRLSGGGDQDLKSVEAAVQAQLDEKDDLTNKINDLNKEMTKFNSSVAQLTKQASAAEERARDKREKQSEYVSCVARREELHALHAQLKEKEEKIRLDSLPLGQKIKKYVDDRKRCRAHASDEETGLNQSLNAFRNDVNRLSDLNRKINEYSRSNKAEQYDEVVSHLTDVTEKVAVHKKERDALLPQLEEVKSLVKEQQRREKNLLHNVQLLEGKSELKVLKEEIAEQEKEKRKIEYHDTVHVRVQDCLNRIKDYQGKKDRQEGRYHEIVERIRSIRRKLKAPEYRNVEREFKVEMIKYETTKMGVEDLKKFQKALDMALLQYHSSKLAEVNKIVRELWMMTYKGQDIQSIEIVSGQEPGSKAQKSYNYRVVMTKGSTEIDMRGRCSAGQRVLASIVIRLALAESFGINCGCIALDEPTVNLDFDNKKGLAIALAQIIASRSKQSNFQLILITHDEEFVGMMKTELTSLTGFSMPEKYFSVCREQGSDGKYYSKVHVCDWEDL